MSKTWNLKPLAALTLTALTCLAAALPVRYGSMFSEDAKAVAVDAMTGDVYVTGNRFKSAAVGYEAYLVKYNAAGVLQWSRSFGGAGTDCGLDVVVAPTGFVYVCGYVQAVAGGPTQAFVARANAAGVIVGPMTFGGGGDDVGKFVRMDPGGGVVVGGAGDVAGAGRDFIAARFTPGLVGIAAMTWGFGNDDEPLGMAVGMTGVYLAGKSVNAAGDLDGIVARFTVGGLAFLNVRPMAGVAGGDDVLSDVGVDAVGAVYVTGAQSTAALGTQVLTAKLNAALTGVLWNNVFNATTSADDDWSNRLRVVNNGVIVGGACRGVVSAAADGLLLAYDSFGTFVAGYPWFFNYIDHDEVVDLAYDSAAGAVYALMASDGAVGHDYATARIAGGATTWVRRYHFLNHDEPADLALTPVGNVVVTGRSEGLMTGFDWATGCYNGATGADVW